MSATIGPRARAGRERIGSRARAGHERIGSRARVGAVLAALVAGAGLTLVTAGGCTWFDGDPPPRTCRSNNDCFRAQGEHCIDSVCVMIDAAPPFAPDDPADDPALPHGTSAGEVP